MIKTNIIVEKTARYFTLGNFSKDTKNIWIVCHGYAQLANHFINWFKCIENNKNVIIAPEALHRFYWKGFEGKVVSSWMTKEDRLDDIKDYVNYLDKVVYSTLKNKSETKNFNINILGFSQGVSTVCRWVTNSKFKFNNLILWAGTLPEDIDYKKNRDLLNSLNIQIAVGNEDPFYDNKKLEEQIQLLNKENITHRIIKFKGNHKVLPEPLIKLNKELSK